jgi:hypothetical protein
VSDRLEELRRQRALQREHLDWIEREIAALEEAARRPPGAEPAAFPPEARADERTAEAILGEYALPAASIEKRTRLGCLLYLALALALTALAVFAVYLHARSARGH